MAETTDRVHRSTRTERLRLSGVLFALVLAATTLVGVELSASSPASANSDFTQWVPVLKEAKANGTYVSLKFDRNRSDLKGYNLYRDGEYFKTWDKGTVYNDYDGEQGDRYYIVAVSRDGKFSKKSSERTATGGGEVSGVRNLRATEVSTNQVKLTWQATSTAVKEFRIYRNHKIWRTVKASTRNPGGTYTYVDGWSTPDNAATYQIRPIGHNGKTGQIEIVLTQHSAKIALDYRNGSGKGSGVQSRSHTGQVVGGRSPKSQQLAASLNAASGATTTTRRNANIATAGAVGVTGISLVSAAGSGGMASYPAGLSTVAAWTTAMAAHAAHEDAKMHEQKAQELLDACKASSSCWNGAPPPRPGGDGPGTTTATTTRGGNCHNGNPGDAGNINNQGGC